MVLLATGIWNLYIHLCSLESQQTPLQKEFYLVELRSCCSDAASTRYFVFLWDFSVFRVRLDSLKKHKNKQTDPGSHKPATPTFCQVKLLFLSAGSSRSETAAVCLTERHSCGNILIQLKCALLQLTAACPNCGCAEHHLLYVTKRLQIKKTQTITLNQIKASMLVFQVQLNISFFPWLALVAGLN